MNWYKSISYSFEYPKAICPQCKKAVTEEDFIFSLGNRIWHWDCHLIFFKERYEKEFEWLMKKIEESGGLNE